MAQSTIAFSRTVNAAETEVYLAMHMGTVLPACCDTTRRCNNEFEQVLKI